MNIYVFSMQYLCPEYDDNHWVDGLIMKFLHFSTNVFIFLVHPQNIPSFKIYRVQNISIEIISYSK